MSVKRRDGHWPRQKVHWTVSFCPTRYKSRDDQFHECVREKWFNWESFIAIKVIQFLPYLSSIFYINHTTCIESPFVRVQWIYEMTSLQKPTTYCTLGWVIWNREFEAPSSVSQHNRIIIITLYLTTMFNTPHSEEDKEDEINQFPHSFDASTTQDSFKRRISRA